MQNKNAGSHFAGYDIAIAHNTQINNLYVKALIMQLERLNNKIDKLIEKKWARVLVQSRSFDEMIIILEFLTSIRQFLIRI